MLLFAPTSFREIQCDPASSPETQCDPASSRENPNPNAIASHGISGVSAKGSRRDLSVTSYQVPGHPVRHSVAPGEIPPGMSGQAARDPAAFHVGYSGIPWHLTASHGTSHGSPLKSPTMPIIGKRSDIDSSSALSAFKGFRSNDHDITTIACVWEQVMNMRKCCCII